MKTLKDFTSNEKRILESILQKGIVASKTGFVSKLPKEGKQTGGYIICLRYDDEVNSEIQGTSEHIHELSGGNSIIYGIENAHQTVSDFGLQEYNEGEFKPDEEVLKSLTKIANKSFKQFKNGSINPAPYTMFDDYVPSDDSVILRPLENRGTYTLICSAVNFSQVTDTPLKGTWGRHITPSRFTEDLSPEQSQRVGKFLVDKDGVTLKKFPCYTTEEISFAKSLDVCTLTATRKGFNLETYESFNF